MSHRRQRQGGVGDVSPQCYGRKGYICFHPPKKIRVVYLHPFPPMFGSRWRACHERVWSRGLWRADRALSPLLNLFTMPREIHTKMFSMQVVVIYNNNMLYKLIQRPGRKHLSTIITIADKMVTDKIIAMATYTLFGFQDRPNYNRPLQSNKQVSKLDEN